MSRTLLVFVGLVALAGACQFADTSVCTSCNEDADNCAATIIAYCDQNEDSACDSVGVTCPFAESATFGTESPCEADVCVGASVDADACEQQIYDYCASQAALEAVTTDSDIYEQYTADSACASVTSETPAGLESMVTLEAESDAVLVGNEEDWYYGTKIPHSGEFYIATLVNSAYYTYTIPVSGFYSIFISWAPHPNRASAAPVTITHAFGTTQQTYNMKAGGNNVNAGFFYFTQGFELRVDFTSEGLDGFLCLDAIAIDNYREAQIFTVDNDDTEGVVFSGTFLSGSKVTHYGADYDYSNTHGDTVTFTIPIEVPGTYIVAAFVPIGTNRDTSVPYEITHDDGTSTVRIDHTALQAWNFLGAYDFTTQAVVTMTVDQEDGSTGFAMVDAIRAYELQAEILVDADYSFSDGITETGDWTTKSFSTSTGYLGDNYRWTGSGDATMTYTPTILQDGNYEVFAWSMGHSNRDPQARHVIVDNSGYNTIVEVDQRVNQNSYNSLGIFNFVAGTFGSATIMGRDGTFVTADAMFFRHVGYDNTYIYDIEHYINDASVIQQTGTWTKSTGQPGHEVRYYYSVEPGATTTFSPDIGAEGADTREYRLYTMYSSDDNRPTDAAYTVQIGSSTYELTIDQTQNGATWVALGRYTIDPSEAFSVTITCPASGAVIADAIKLQGLTPQEAK